MSEWIFDQLQNRALEQTEALLERRRAAAAEVLARPLAERVEAARALLAGIDPTERSVVIPMLLDDVELHELLLIETTRSDLGVHRDAVVTRLGAAVDLRRFLGPRDGGLATHYAALELVIALCDRHRPGEGRLAEIPDLPEVASAIATAIRDDRPRTVGAIAAAAAAAELEASAAVRRRDLDGLGRLLADDELIPPARFAWLHRALEAELDRRRGVLDALSRIAPSVELLTSVAAASDRRRELAAALRSGNDEEQALAAWAIGRFHPDIEGAVPLLDARTEPPASPAIRAACWGALVRIEPDRAGGGQLLDDLLTARDADTRAAAIDALAALACAPDPRPRWALTAVKTGLGDFQVAPCLAALRTATALGMVDLAGEAVSLLDRSEIDPTAVLGALASLGHGGARVRSFLVDELLPFLENDDEDEQAARDDGDDATRETLEVLAAAARVVFPARR